MVKGCIVGFLDVRMRDACLDRSYNLFSPTSDSEVTIRLPKVLGQASDKALAWHGILDEVESSTEEMLYNVSKAKQASFIESFINRARSIHICSYYPVPCLFSLLFFLLLSLNLPSDPIPTGYDGSLDHSSRNRRRRVHIRCSSRRYMVRSGRGK